MAARPSATWHRRTAGAVAALAFVAAPAAANEGGRAARKPPGARGAGHSRQVPTADRIAGWNRDAVAAYEAGDIEQALTPFPKAAARNDPSALYDVAVIRLRDESKRMSIAAAIRHLRASAASGFTPARFMLAFMPETGQHLKASQKEATDWYERAAEQGHPDAQLAVATQYYLGRGVDEDPARAASWYRKAADGGDVGAQYPIASMYEAGLGVPQDLQQALEWYTMAARQGDVAATGKARLVAARIAAQHGR